MKKLFQLGAAIFAILMTNVLSLSADQYSEYQDSGYVADNNVVADSGNVAYDNQAPNDACCDQPTGDCWCLYCHYEPCYYTTQRCCEYKVPCKRRCCRYVPKYYEVQRCRYVPQYYCETCCCQVPEYYCVDECKTCYKTVCDQHCKYVPRYYWKHVCKDNKAAACCDNR